MGIYVITHKFIDKKPKLSEEYNWLYVGASSQTDKQQGYLYDDTGTNISDKNPYFCELTGLYWIVNNSKDNIKGLTHYRRFFTRNPLSNKDKYFYSYSELEAMLSQYDCLLPNRLYFPYGNIGEYYKKNHNAKDLDILREVIQDVSEEYLEAYDQAFAVRYMFPYNMMVAKKEIFDSYCQWLFKVLLEFEKKIDVSGRGAYQSRVYGFLAERLLNVWIIKNGIKYKEIGCIQTDSRFRYRIRILLERIFARPLLSR